MAYQGTLMNRFAQLGYVWYDLLVTDDAGLLPDYRHLCTLPAPRDVPAIRTALLSRAVAAATVDQTRAARLGRLQDMMSDLQDTIALAQQQQAALQAVINGGNF